MLDDQIAQRLDQLTDDLADLRRTIEKESNINQEQTEHLAVLVSKNYRNVERLLAALGVFAFLLLVCLLGLRIESDGFSFGLPIEVSIPLLGVVVTLTTLYVKDYLGKNLEKN